MSDEDCRAFSTGYVSFRTRGDIVTATKEGERRCVRIVPLATPGPILTLPELTLCSRSADELVSAIQW
ncbi:MAG: hypothetical protein HY329_12875 [Chloroflexi bacterium]|nr:hypothetical protein [Chloroflexota bacterium]